MNCEKLKEILGADYIDGELSNEHLKAADEHLSVCPGCRQFKVELIKNAVTPFNAVEKAVPPEYVWQNIRAAIAENPYKNPALPGFLKRYAGFSGISVAAAAVLLVFGSFLYFGQPFKHPENLPGYSADESDFAYLYEGVENNDQEPAAAEDEDLLS